MSELTASSIKKLKVAELRAELLKRGADTKGKKDELVTRLFSVLSTPVAEVSGDGGQQIQQAGETAAEPTGDGEETKEEPENAEIGEAEVSDAAAAADVEMADDEEQPSTTAPEEKATDAEMSASTSEEKKDEQASGDTEKAAGSDGKPAAVEEPKPPAELVDKLMDVEVEEEELLEEPTHDVDKFVLDSFSSDLHFLVNEDGLGGRNLIKNGFCYMWAGVRATHGVTSGKICYECKVVKKLEIEAPDLEEPTHAVRIGWSSEKSSLQLGEASLSYGYESSGKICASSNFSAYGQTFDEGDVIGAYLDLESEPKSIKYTKNGEDLGVAMSLTVNLDGKSLFPHIFVKNMEISVNFGSQEEPWFEPLEGHSFVNTCENLVRTVIPPESKGDCEVVMMVGLPSAGKTVWAQKYVSENKDKKYKVISQTHVLERMKVEGQAKKKSSAEFEKFMLVVVRVLNKMFAMAPTKRRNYVLDQVNVHASVRKAKLEMFEGFKRKAVVIIPTHDNLRKRCYEKRQHDTTELPYLALADLKCNFVLPETGDLLDEVVFPELDGRNAAKTVEDYHSDGRHAVERGRDEPNRKRRYDDRHDNRNRYDERRRYDDRRSYQGGSYDSRSRQQNRSGARPYPMQNEPYRRNFNNSGGGYRQYRDDGYGSGMKPRGGQGGFGRGGWNQGGWNQGGGWGQGGGFYQGGGGGNYYQGGGNRGGGGYNNRGYGSGYSGGYGGSGYSSGYNYRGGYR